jgi:carbonic anhydrase
VAPNWYASTDPGDLFVIRNIGNLVPPCHPKKGNDADHSVAAAIEFALGQLTVTDIIVCGHSGCGAMQAKTQGLEKLPETHLRHWLSAADIPSLTAFPELITRPKLSPEDTLSQKNVLQQLENLKSHSKVRDRLADNTLRLHGWWFEIAEGGVHAYDPSARQFLLIDDSVAERLLAKAPTTTK